MKAHGPHGFPGVFYQKFWPIVKDIVSGVASGFLGGVEQVKLINRTHIALISKVADPESLDQFRPISLCNKHAKFWLSY